MLHPRLITVFRSRAARDPRLAPIILVAWLAMSGLAADSSQEVDENRANAVKAVYLCNFFKHVDWPAEAPGARGDTLTIAVVGEDPYGALLEEAARGRMVKNRSIAIRRWASFEAVIDDGDDGADARTASLRGCHLLFVCESEAKIADRLRALVADHAVLTVSDLDGFAGDGGMIEFALDRRTGTIGLRINRAEAERAGLTVSAKLLRIAKIIETEP